MYCSVTVAGMRSGCAEVLLRFPDEPGPNLLGNPLPLCTILDRGIRVPLSYGDQGGGQALLAQTTGQQVSRTLTRDDEECREDLHRSWDASGSRRTGPNRPDGLSGQPDASNGL